MLQHKTEKAADKIETNRENFEQVTFYSGDAAVFVGKCLLYANAYLHTFECVLLSVD